jgi:hypothetical protein
LGFFEGRIAGSSTRVRSSDMNTVKAGFTLTGADLLFHHALAAYSIVSTGDLTQNHQWEAALTACWGLTGCSGFSASTGLEADVVPPILNLGRGVLVDPRMWLIS